MMPVHTDFTVRATFYTLKKLAATFLDFDAEALEKASAVGEIAAVTNDGEDGKQG